MTAAILLNEMKFNAFASLAEAFEEVECCWEKEGVKAE